MCPEENYFKHFISWRSRTWKNSCRRSSFVSNVASSQSYEKENLLARQEATIQQISDYTLWNQPYFSTMVLPKAFLFRCFAEGFLLFTLKDSFKKIKITSSFSLSFISVFRSSQRRCSIKIGFRFLQFIKKETLAQVSSCKFCEIFKNAFFTEHLWTTVSLFVIL